MTFKYLSNSAMYQVSLGNENVDLELNVYPVPHLLKHIVLSLRITVMENT